MMQKGTFLTEQQAQFTLYHHLAQSVLSVIIVTDLHQVKAIEDITDRCRGHQARLVPTAKQCLRHRSKVPLVHQNNPTLAEVVQSLCTSSGCTGSFMLLYSSQCIKSRNPKA
jgi:hydroxyethylthiazole kinase-like sugar kinase family protein